MREARRKVCPGTTSLITCSLRVSDGFLRAMSTCRVRSAWLVRGSSWSFHKNDSSATPVAPASTGATSRVTLTPPACSAVIPLSPARRVHTCSTATNPAIGSALGLACNARGGGGGGASRPREFAAGRAFGYLEQQMQFGPRVPGTPAHERTGDWILQHLRATADSVAVQSFTHVTRQGATLRLRNLLARFRPAATERVLVLAHRDGRPHPDPRAHLGQQRLPVPGANDGASGVALLLGVADVLKGKPPTVGVDLLFVDGEDYGDFSTDSNDVLIGSRYFASHQPS